MCEASRAGHALQYVTECAAYKLQQGRNDHEV